MRFGFNDRTRELLRGIWHTGTISGAASRIGMDPGNASRHLRAAERRWGVRLVERHRGGRGRPNARLTAPGRRALRWGSNPGLALPYDEASGVTPVRVAGRTLYAAGNLPAGPVEVQIRPESVALERPSADHPPSSVRNRFAARVESIQTVAEGVYRVGLSAGAFRLEAMIVRGALRELRLRPGSRVRAVVKAVNVSVAPRTA